MCIHTINQREMRPLIQDRQCRPCFDIDPICLCKMNYETKKHGRTVIFNNMVTPYSNRLYNELVERGQDIEVISCTNEEPNRHWAQSIASNYPRKILPGWTLQLSQARFAHINIGILRTYVPLAPPV